MTYQMLTASVPNTDISNFTDAPIQTYVFYKNIVLPNLDVIGWITGLTP